MYSVMIKTDLEYKDYIVGVSLGNAIMMAENLVIDLVGYLEGYGHGHPIFLSSHPTSTYGTPEYYCIPCGQHDSTYKIYKHIKNNGYITSWHEYIKLYTVKIMRNRQNIPKTYDYIYHNRDMSDQKIIFDKITNHFNQRPKSEEQIYIPETSDNTCLDTYRRRG